MVANLRLLPVLLLLLLEAGVGEAGEDSTTLDPGAKTSSVTLSEGNLRANKAPYWAGAWATAAAPTAGTYYVEMEVGNVFGSYAGFGLLDKSYFDGTPPSGFSSDPAAWASQLTLDWQSGRYLPGLACKLNDGHCSGYLPESKNIGADGLSTDVYKTKNEFPIAVDGRTGYDNGMYFSGVGEVQIAMFVDFDVGKFWVGTARGTVSTAPALTWFPGDPSDSATGFSFVRPADAKAPGWDGQTPLTFFVNPSTTSGNAYFHVRFDSSTWKYEAPARSVIPVDPGVSLDVSGARGTQSAPAKLGGASLGFAPSGGLVETAVGPDQGAKGDTAWDTRKGAFHTVELGGAGKQKIPLGAGIKILDAVEVGCTPADTDQACVCRIACPAGMSRKKNVPSHLHGRRPSRLRSVVLCFRPRHATIVQRRGPGAQTRYKSGSVRIGPQRI